jgi:hypothetical protein
MLHSSNAICTLFIYYKIHWRLLAEELHRFDLIRGPPVLQLALQSGPCSQIVKRVIQIIHNLQISNAVSRTVVDLFKSSRANNSLLKLALK